MLGHAMIASCAVSPNFCAPHFWSSVCEIGGFTGCRARSSGLKKIGSSNHLPKRDCGSKAVCRHQFSGIRFPGVQFEEPCKNGEHFTLRKKVLTLSLTSLTTTQPPWRKTLTSRKAVESCFATAWRTRATTSLSKASVALNNPALASELKCACLISF